MEFDLDIILYIIIFVIYILAKTLKKPKPKHTPPKPRPNIDAEAHEAEPTMTFEGIFRELTVDKKKEKPGPVKVINEVEELESSYYPSDDEIQEVYKESLIQAEKSKTLEQIVHDNSKKKRVAILESEKFSAYRVEEITSLASELGEMLKNPEDARKAIVLKEKVNVVMSLNPGHADPYWLVRCSLSQSLKNLIGIFVR